VIVSVTPEDGSFFRRPSPINITVAIRNDPGNGLSSNESCIFLDGSPLPTEVRGDAGNWELQALFSEFTHGWHTISAIAVDKQGLGAWMEWKVFVSLIDPLIYDLHSNRYFSRSQPLHITADASEPVKYATVSFPDYPYYTFSVLVNSERIDILWNGWLGGYYSMMHPDGTVRFNVYASGQDGVKSNTLEGSAVYDNTPPVLSVTSGEAYCVRTPDISGLIDDITGIAEFRASISSGNLSCMFSSTNFIIHLDMPSDGYYILNLSATDVLGNTMKTTQRIIIDTVNPTVDFIEPIGNSTVRPAQKITFRVSDTLSGLARDYLLYQLWERPPLLPEDFHVFLDEIEITDRLKYTGRSYFDALLETRTYGSYQMTYNYIASLGGIIASYDPRPYGYLSNGTHQLRVQLKDRAGNVVESSLFFHSLTGSPEITERNMDMVINDQDETLIVTFDVQENSDGGFDRFILTVDGRTVDVTPSVTYGNVPYRCTVGYTFTDRFDEGPHSVSLQVIDGRGYESTLNTGFYHLERVDVPFNDFNARYEYIPDFQVYSGNHTHDLRLDPSTYFTPGSSALYGQCAMDGPSPTLLLSNPERSGNWILPMGGQLAFTVAETPFINAANSQFLSLWMTDINVVNNNYWGWGAGILAYFDDGSGYSLLAQDTKAIEGFDKLSTLSPPAILYVRHEAPWVNWQGIVDNSARSMRGADGKIWNNYIIKIPDGLNRRHIRVILVWETVNWLQHSLRVPVVSVSSKIDNIQFIKSVVDYTRPADGSDNVELRPTIMAHFIVPMDPSSFNQTKFHLRNSAGDILCGTAYYDEATRSGYFKPLDELGGLREFTGYISQDIRTIYGVVLPKTSPYTWKFQTRRGESNLWQTIRYNGEEYCVYLLWGPGYQGGTPGYLNSPSYLESTYGRLLEIHVIKKVGNTYYEVGDPDLARTIFQAAQRKAFYSKLTENSSELVSDSLTEWVEDRADQWSGEVLRLLGYIFSDPAPIPSDKETIKEMIAYILGDGSTPTTLTGVDQALSWLSTAIAGATKVNDLVEKLRKMKAQKAGVPFQETVVGDVLSIAELVNGELQFQKDLWEFLFKCMWQMRVTENYRSQLQSILPYTYGDTKTAISEMLSADISSVQREIRNKVLAHIGTQTVNFIKDKVFDVISKNPYGMIVITTFKVFFKLASFTRWDDVHKLTHLAVAYADAEDSFYNARLFYIGTFRMIPSGSVTVYDTSLPAVASRLWYGAGGKFFETMVNIGNIVKKWPTSDTASWNAVIPSYQNHASNYLTRSNSFIPEVYSSNADMMSLLPLVKRGTAGKPSNIYIAAHSPIVLLVTAPDGRRIGYDPSRPEGDRIVNDFGSLAFYNSPYSEPQVMVIPAGIGELRIQAFGVDTDSYRITVEVLDENGNPISGSEWTGNITPGVYKFFSILIDEYGSTYKYDGRAPLIRVSGVSWGGRYTGTVRPLIEVDDDNLEGWFATLNGKLYNGAPVTSPGVYTLVVRATDGVNVVYSTVIFMIQGVSPVKPAEEGENGGAWEAVGVQAAYAVSGAVSEVPSKAVVPPAEMVNVTPAGMGGGYDYTWLAVSLLVSVLIIGVYGALRRRNT